MNYPTCYGISTYDYESESTHIHLVCRTEDEAKSLIQRVYDNCQKGIDALPPKGETSNTDPRYKAYAKLGKDADDLIPGSGFHVVQWCFHAVGELTPGDVYLTTALDVTEIGLYDER